MWWAMFDYAPIKRKENPNLIQWRQLMFKKGQKVKCVDASDTPFVEGNIYTVDYTTFEDHTTYLCVEEQPGYNWFLERFVPVDEIKAPTHYTQRGGIEPIDFITSNNMNWLEGNVVKYVYRYGFKGGEQDLKKAQFYLQKLMEVTYGLQEEQNEA